jgi:hypothetical protein
VGLKVKWHKKIIYKGLNIVFKVINRLLFDLYYLLIRRIESERV